MSPSRIGAESVSTLRDTGPVPVARAADFAPNRSADFWDSTTISGLFFLIALWGWRVYSTWATWGNLTIDSGHEMYIPALLAQGKVLYRDVWFMYGPAAPYFNSYLFRWFGIHLNVLYAAGSLAALGSALFLCAAGIELSAWLVGWTAGAVLLLEAFEPTLFCFPLPYSFSAVYACFTACLFLWLVIRGSVRTSWLWVLAAGSTAALALLLKPEFGMACYLTMMLWMAERSFRERSFWRAAKDIAAILPGVVACGVVIWWMISIRGVEFITQENIVSWPTSYFMKHYGKLWLDSNGFALNAAAFGDAAMRALLPAGVLLEIYCLLNWKRIDLRSAFIRVALLASLIAYCVVLGLNPQQSLAALVFPRDMVLYVAIAAVVAWLWFFRQPEGERRALILSLTFASLLAFRILLKTEPSGYPIFYNGPVVLCFLALVTLLIRRAFHNRKSIFAMQAAVCIACLLSVVLYERATFNARGFVPLVTERGTVRVAPRMAQNYQVAIQFMKGKAALGESVLSVPEDTSLYFLSETECPTRVFSFTPGVLVPGKMTDELIAEINRKPVRYLLWSNRFFFEFGVPVFGKDFDQEFGEFLRSRYHRVGLLIPDDLFSADWNAQVWERNDQN
jgi:hypothetical protein